MQLSSPVSLLFDKKTTHDFQEPKSISDPAFKIDFIKKLRKSRGHWKNVQQFRFKNKIHYTRDAELAYFGDVLRVLYADYHFYSITHRHTSEEGAILGFSESLTLYRSKIGYDLVKRAILQRGEK